jgi:hypothetical protein
MYETTVAAEREPFQWGFSQRDRANTGVIDHW